MFNNISKRYDLLNRVLSLGVDQYWRRRAVKMLKKEKPQLVLDIATGTADFAIQALKAQPEKVIGVDISQGMLDMGRQKLKRMGLDQKIELRLGDSEKLLFEHNTFDSVIVAFGVRNFENLEKGLADIERVLKPGGKAFVVEFSNPRSVPFKQLYWFYSKYILPAVGRLVSKDRSAYTYLPESVKAFPDGTDFLAIMEKCGFIDTKWTPMTFGICSIYVGQKPPA